MKFTICCCTGLGNLFLKGKMLDIIYKNLSKDITLIMIAHRLKTLSSCDYIIDIKNGRVNRKIYPNQYDEVLYRK